VLLATFLALGAAVLHASWNLAVKQTVGDRYIAIWGQFFVVLPLVLLLIAVFPPRAGVWPWAAFSGAVHIPYAWFLAKGYQHGDFSVVYPIARGGGAALGAISGLLFLGDRVGPWGVVGIVVVCIGLVALPTERRGAAVQSALMVSLSIAAYSVADAKGIRTEGSWRYVLASAACGAIALTLWGLARGSRTLMVTAVRTRWKPLAMVGIAANVTYGMVQVAMQYAPVGYVSALRESSVVLAALVGARLLNEDAGVRRFVCSLIVATGVILLIVAR
jgi:multidrug transporter EmrE-like cation transporter